MHGGGTHNDPHRQQPLGGAFPLPEGAWGFIPTKSGPSKKGLLSVLKNSVLLKGTGSLVP
jgi:hypothetical protein